MSEWLHLEGDLLQAKNFDNEFLLLRFGASSDISLPALGKVIYDQNFDFVEEVIATNAEICIQLNDRFSDNSLVLLSNLDWVNLASLPKAARPPMKAPIYFYDEGDGWKEIYRQTNFSRESYIEQLLSCRFEVAMFGFLPGFLYLTGLPAELHVSRKKTPEKRTDAGAFAIGGKYAGIYSLPSPAGWNVVGLLGVLLLETSQLPPLMLAPGDAIVLEQVSELEYHELISQQITVLEYNGLSHRP